MISVSPHIQPAHTNVNIRRLLAPSPEAVIYGTASLGWLVLLVASASNQGRAVDATQLEATVIATSAVIWGAGLIVKSRRDVRRTDPLPVRGTRPAWWDTIGQLTRVMLATAWLIVGAASWAVLLAVHGAVVSHNPASNELTVGQVHQHMAWEVLGALPVVDIPDTLGWERPIEDPAASIGVLSVMLRGVFVLFVLKLLVVLARRLRPLRPPPSPLDYVDPPPRDTSDSVSDTEHAPRVNWFL
jgi:hypothetical protein